MMQHWYVNIFCFLLNFFQCYLMYEKKTGQLKKNNLLFDWSLLFLIYFLHRSSRRRRDAVRSEIRLICFGMSLFVSFFVIIWFFSCVFQLMLSTGRNMVISNVLVVPNVRLFCVMIFQLIFFFEKMMFIYNTCKLRVY